MTFLTAILTRIKVTLWFATVNRYRGWKAKRKLEAYKKTLSPAQAAKANALEAKLKGTTPGQAVAILRREAEDLQRQHAKRVTEAIDRFERNRSNT